MARRDYATEKAEPQSLSSSPSYMRAGFKTLADGHKGERPSRVSKSCSTTPLARAGYKGFSTLDSTPPKVRWRRGGRGGEVHC